MTATISVCLLLGSASAADASSDSYTQVLPAKTADDLSSAKTGLENSSIDKLDIVVKASELSSVYNPMELATWVPFLKLEALVGVKVMDMNGSGTLQPITTSFLLAGLSSVSERKEADGSRILVASRKALPNISATQLKRSTGVAVTLNLGDDDDADMIDEDGLLEDTTNLLAPPPAMNATATASADDCAGRKPCDNCTCGRADAEAGNNQPKQAPSSSCGKCHLGDAFRCASCPYLGKPAFKAGEEHLVLDLTDDL